jgi:hypothetical protein
MQEQNTEKTVALSVKTGKMTAKVLKGAVKVFLDAQKNKKPHIYKGKQSVKHLVQGGGELTSIEVTDKNIKSFDKTARKYGIDYALKKDTTEEPPKYLVFFKAKNNDVLTMAFKEFAANELTKSKKTPIREKLRNVAEQVKAKNKERSREKSKSREATL